MLAWRLGLAPGGAELRRIRDGTHPSAGLAAAVDLAYRTGTVARAIAWYRTVATREPHLRPEDAEAIPYGLKLFLADGPIGAWDPAR